MVEIINMDKIAQGEGEKRAKSLGEDTLTHPGVPGEERQEHNAIETLQRKCVKQKGLVIPSTQHY